MRGFPDLPPVWLAGSAVAAWLLAKYLPLVVFDVPGWLGWAVFAFGFLWAGSAALLFLVTRTPVEPRHTPRVLLADFHFRINRNPIYSGLTLMLVGWALVLGALTAFLPAAVFPIIITGRFIVDEERRLRAAFGKAAEEYFAR